MFWIYTQCVLKFDKMLTKRHFLPLVALIFLFPRHAVIGAIRANATHCEEQKHASYFLSLKTEHFASVVSYKCLRAYRMLTFGNKQESKGLLIFFTLLAEKIWYCHLSCHWTQHSYISCCTSTDCTFYALLGARAIRSPWFVIANRKLFRGNVNHLSCCFMRYVSDLFNLAVHVVQIKHWFVYSNKLLLRFLVTRIFFTTP